MRDLSLEKMERGFRMVLEGLGVDTGGDHFRDTPRRAAKAWHDEICRGLTAPPPKITTFPSGIDQMVILKDIPIHSVCAHHLLPFFGTAAVAYVPGKGEVLGLSKLSRISDYWARRPQVQEELTEQIADAVADEVMDGTNGGVGVVIRANHMCMQLRGVNHAGNMVTSALRGVLREGEARAEFLKLALGD